MNVIRVALVDDYEIVRRGLCTMLGGHPDLAVVAECGSYAAALAEIPVAAPDVALVDVRLGEDDGVRLCADLAVVAPDVRCLLLTAFPDDDALVRAYDAGAAAFLLKEVGGATLVDAIRAVAGGRALLDERAAALAAERVAAAPYDSTLTPQERRVVALLTEGLTNRQIGDQLGLSEKTVKNYVSNVLTKLGMAHRSEVAVYGARVAARLADDRAREHSREALLAAAR